MARWLDAVCFFGFAGHRRCAVNWRLVDMPSAAHAGLCAFELPLRKRMNIRLALAAGVVLAAGLAEAPGQAAPALAREIRPQVQSTGRVARAERVVTEEDRKHWSYLPLRHPAWPTLQTPAGDSQWIRNPVDRFVAAKLQEKGMALSPSADARKLVRRIYFDLIGLPPAPDQVESFVRAFAGDPREAVASLVDQLLSDPHYGERWARHWLDVVRYADSDGQESDAD